MKNGTSGVVCSTPVFASVATFWGLQSETSITIRRESAAALALNFQTNYGYVYPMQYRNDALVLGAPVSLGDIQTSGARYIAAGDLNGDFVFDLFLSGSKGPIDVRAIPRFPSNLDAPARRIYEEIWS